VGIKRAIRQAQPNHFLFPGEQLFNDLVRASLDEDKFVDTSFMSLSVNNRNYITISDVATAAMRDLLVDRISYLGPLRHSPRRVYETAGQPPVDVGVTGNDTPELLCRLEKSPLLRPLSKWLAHFDLPTTVFPRTLGDSAFSLFAIIDDHRTEVNFADLGFGISQLFPLIVQSLMTSGGRYLITEQPEIHLNPKLQARLADLFADVVRRDGRVVVETHSEHLLMRLRRLVAEKVVPSSDVALYFVEHDQTGSHVREVPIAENGHVAPDSWPAGFFDQGYSEAAALALAQRSRGRNVS
jgi:hypothetical protein